jgi:glycosyltransferase involved in cell wall biosynthesis
MKHDSEDRFFFQLSEEDVPAPPPENRSTPQPRRLALIGCFRPRRCGIATFTADSFDHLRSAAPALAIDIYAMRGRPGDADDPDVRLAIDEQDASSYRAAAEAINASGADAVWLQHEFGIFGGPAGAMVLELVEGIAAPLIVTLHTVLEKPSAEQRAVMERLVARASKLVVMSEFGRGALIDIYGADADQIEIIEHGTPERPFVQRSPLRDRLGTGDRPILSTFGLIGPGKGLETAIRALPAIAAQYPDILYRIVGATHPNLVAAEGEAYRDSLKALAEELGVAQNIAWDNRFLDTGELLDQIELCDIYLAPYPNLQQVTSGTLAYAVALGRAVVSTPFVHARELLRRDVGIILPACDSDAIAEAVLLLLGVPEERRALQQRAYERGRQTAWSAIAGRFAALISDVVVQASAAPTRRGPSLAGLWAMCDDVGILQHGTGIVPDRNHGYCIDDNARALMFVHGLRQTGGEAERHMLTFASFLQHAWNPERGRFRNFMGYDRRWLEEAGSEDSNGRTLWALGHSAAKAHRPDFRRWAAGWFERAAPMANEFKSPRAIAFALLGADHLLDRDPDHATARAIVERGGAFLSALWKSARRAHWDWFEAGLAYDNARLAEALIRAGRRLPSLPHEEAGLSALDWLCARQTAAAGHFRPMGSEGFGRDGEYLPFDQQPIEAWATIAACATAFSVTRQPVWRERAETAWRWFLGDNDRGLALGDVRTGRCLDGLTPRGVNLNCGAESILAFHLAHQAMAESFWPADTAPLLARTAKVPALAA